MRGKERVKQRREGSGRRREERTVNERRERQKRGEGRRHERQGKEGRVVGGLGI